MVNYSTCKSSISIIQQQACNIITAIIIMKQLFPAYVMNCTFQFLEAMYDIFNFPKHIYKRLNT